MRATFKIILFSRANKGGLRPVMLRVTFLRRARYYPLHRHCYANAHRLAGTPPEIIRQLMGHSDFKTSEAYLSEFGDDALDRADRGVF